MSATLDSELFARYFGGCPTLAAGGRTFPVEHLFLEDVYELTDYRLDAEGPNALRGTSDGAKRRALQKAAGSQQSLLKVCPCCWKTPWDTCSLSGSVVRCVWRQWPVVSAGGQNCVATGTSREAPQLRMSKSIYKESFKVECAVAVARCDSG